jgi:hypothetical protein
MRTVEKRTSQLKNGEAADTTPTKERVGVDSAKYMVQAHLFRH